MMQTITDVKTEQVIGLRFKVGIVGLQPGRSRAARAHIPDKGDQIKETDLFF